MNYTPYREKENWTVLKDGAGNEIRTRDNHLGKVALYQLSYSRMKLFMDLPRIVIRHIESFIQSTVIPVYFRNGTQ